MNSVPDGAGLTPGRYAVDPFVIIADVSQFSALAAWLPPLSVTKLTAAMLALVNQRTKQFQVFESVVELVLVAVVNLHP